MKRILSFACIGLMNMSLYAQSDVLPAPRFKLDEVDFVVSERVWLQTQSALLIVGVNTTLQNGDMVKARASIMERLNQLGKGEWQITQFNRSQDSSGLEKLDVEAKLRINQTDLTQVYNVAKKISQPGMAFHVVSIDFKPSFEELELAKSKLRSQVYEKIMKEISAINKVYPDEHYSVHKIRFFEGDEPVFARGAAPKATNMIALAQPAPDGVSNEIKMRAFVELASNRKGT